MIGCEVAVENNKNQKQVSEAEFDMFRLLLNPKLANYGKEATRGCGSNRCGMVLPRVLMANSEIMKEMGKFDMYRGSRILLY